MISISAKNNLILKISLAYLRSKKYHNLPSLTTVLSFTGIMLGVATLVIFTSIMNGFREELTKKIIGFNAHISIYPTNNTNNHEDLAIADKIKQKYKKIKSALPVLQSSGMALNSHNNIGGGVLIRGLYPKDLSNKIINISKIKSPPQINHTSGDEITIGSPLAEMLQVEIGDKIMLIVPQFNESLFGSIPRHKHYKIAQIISTGMRQYDEILTLMPIKPMQTLMGDTEKYSFIEITLNSTDEVEEMTLQLQKDPLLQNFTIVNWQNENENLSQALKIQKNVMSVVLILFVAVATFSIFSNLAMMVAQKNKDIAILRAMGLSSSEVGVIFYISGSIISIIATTTGAMIGISFAKNIQAIKNFLENILSTKLFDGSVYLLDYLPCSIDSLEVVWICCVAITLSTIASAVPAIRASKTNPAETLKY